MRFMQTILLFGLLLAALGLLWLRARLGVAGGRRSWSQVRAS
ncbi:hypothetical protein [uncultured Hymenobacter sp.]